MPVVNFQVEEIRVKISIAEFIVKLQDFERKSFDMSCCPCYDMTSLLNNKEKAPILNDENVVKLTWKLCYAQLCLPLRQIKVLK